MRLEREVTRKETIEFEDGAYYFKNQNHSSYYKLCIRGEKMDLMVLDNYESRKNIELTLDVYDYAFHYRHVIEGILWVKDGFYKIEEEEFNIAFQELISQLASTGVKVEE